MLPDYREAIVVGHRPVSLDPLIDGQDPGVRALGSLLYRRLLRLDDQAVPVPDLAGPPSVSADGLTYTLNLGPALRWSDGRLLGAPDVLATVAFVQTPKFPSPALSAAWKDVKASASGRSLVFTLPSPRASFAVTLTELPILPLAPFTPSTLAALPARASLPMATSGPYRVDSSGPATIELVINSQANPAPRLHRVELRLFAGFAEAAKSFTDGGVDAVLATTPGERAQVMRHAGSGTHDLVSFRFVNLLFNERVPGLDDPAVRHAIALAIDRARLIHGPLEGMAVGQVGPIPAGIRWVSPPSPPPAADVAGANAGLDAAGWKLGPAGVRSRAGVDLRFSLTVPAADPLPAVAEEVGRQLEAVGIGTTVTVTPTESLLSSVITPHQFQLALADWDNSADPDVSAFWRSSATPPQGLNVSGAADDPFLDQDLDALATISDPTQRRAAAARVATQLAEDAPAVFLYAPEQSLVVNNVISGVVTPPVGDPYADFGSWHH
jgi:peptide/nickel transport system substrate-binding protein